MRTNPFLLLVPLLLLAPPARAQTAFGIGPRVGLNLTTYHFAEPLALGTPKHRAGFEAGVASTVSRGHFALQAALLYSQKGVKEHTSVEIRTGNNTYIGRGDFEHAERLHYLALPLALAYTLRRDGQGLQVFAGPYVSVLLSGRYDNTTTDPSGPADTHGGAITIVSGTAAEYGLSAQRYDAGLQGGLGYRHKGLLFQAGYSLGLRSVAAQTDYQTLLPARSANYNRAFQAALTYLLGPNK